MYFRWAQRYFFKPLALTLVVGSPLALLLHVQATTPVIVAVFLAVNVLLNSRWGRNVDELVTDWVAHAWHRLRIHFFAADVSFYRRPVPSNPGIR